MLDLSEIDATLVPVAGSVGEFGFGGGFGTCFWVDPQEQLAVVFTAATPGDLGRYYRSLVKNLVLAAILD